jgi:hypothetical protein
MGKLPASRGPLRVAVCRLRSSVRTTLSAPRRIRTAGRRLSGGSCSRRVALVALTAMSYPRSTVIQKLSTGSCRHSMGIRKLVGVVRTLHTTTGKVMASRRSEWAARGSRSDGSRASYSGWLEGFAVEESPTASSATNLSTQVGVPDAECGAFVLLLSFLRSFPPAARRPRPPASTRAWVPAPLRPPVPALALR